MFTDIIGKPACPIYGANVAEIKAYILSINQPINQFIQNFWSTCHSKGVENKVMIHTRKNFCFVFKSIDYIHALTKQWYLCFGCVVLLWFSLSYSSIVVHQKMLKLNPKTLADSGGKAVWCYRKEASPQTRAASFGSLLWADIQFWV